jgi:hypothetical protein
MEAGAFLHMKGASLISALHSTMARLGLRVQQGPQSWWCPLVHLGCLGLDLESISPKSLFVKIVLKKGQNKKFTPLS